MSEAFSPRPQLDERLAELERDLGPTLRTAYRGAPMRPGFATELRTRLHGQASRESVGPRSMPRVVRRGVWAAVAAMLIGGVAVSVALFVTRPEPVSAADVLGQIQTEAVSSTSAGVGGPCLGPAQKTGGAVVVASGAARGEGGALPGPTTMANATELSDKLAQTLGVSGDRVREAMLATVRDDMPNPPPDPVAGIAQQLGVSQEQVCQAFFDPAASSHPALSFATSGGSRGSGSGLTGPMLGLNGTVIDLSSADASQLKVPAQKLGVTPERLLEAVRASVPTTPPPLPKLNPDDLISRFAQNLGMNEDTVRAAITKVEGNGRFYFSVPVPLPAFGK